MRVRISFRWQERFNENTKDRFISGVRKIFPVPLENRTINILFLLTFNT
jgi:hypothetical protein